MIGTLVRWPVIVRKGRSQPPTGRWHEWKEIIAGHCEGQCIYCAIHESRFGGIRNFHVEHFRPKSNEAFAHLEDDINNLYLACAICNVLKSDDWPGEPAADHSAPAYPDPFITDYNSLFAISASTREVYSPTVAGSYLIERLILNRPQLLLERRFEAMLLFQEEFEDWIESCLDQITRAEQEETMATLLEVSRSARKAIKSRPYRDSDTKRLTSKAKKRR